MSAGDASIKGGHALIGAAGLHLVVGDARRATLHTAHLAGFLVSASAALADHRTPRLPVTGDPRGRAVQDILTERAPTQHESVRASGTPKADLWHRTERAVHHRQLAVTERAEEHAAGRTGVVNDPWTTESLALPEFNPMPPIFPEHLPAFPAPAHVSRSVAGRRRSGAARNVAAARSVVRIAWSTGLARKPPAASLPPVYTSQECAVSSRGIRRYRELQQAYCTEEPEGVASFEQGPSGGRRRARSCLPCPSTILARHGAHHRSHQEAGVRIGPAGGRDRGGPEGGGDCGVYEHAPPRLLGVGGAHSGEQPAQEHREAVQCGDGAAARLSVAQDRPAGAVGVRGGDRGGAGARRATRRRHHLRPRLFVRLFWFQNARAFVSVAYRRQSGGAAAADADAGGDRHPHARHRGGIGDVRLSQPQVLYTRQPDAVQRGHAAPATELVFPADHDRRLHRGHLRHPQALRAVRAVRGGGAGARHVPGAQTVVRHPGGADRDRRTVHALQGRLQPQEQPAESGHHSLLEPVHRDRGVHLARRGGRVQPGQHRAEPVAGTRDPRGHPQPEQDHQPELLSGAGGAALQPATPPHRHRGAGTGGRVHPDAHAVRERCRAPTERGPVRDHLLPRAVGVGGAGGARRRLRDVRRQSRLQGPAAVRPVGRRARQRSLGLGIAESAHSAARPAQFAAVGADAHRLHLADTRQQRVLRAVHLQPVHAAGAGRRVHRGEPAPGARPAGAGPVERPRQKPDHRAQRLGAAGTGDTARGARPVQDGVGDQPAAPVGYGRRPRRYIDQSQSLNVHIASPNIGKLSSMHFHGWRIGLKTGMYYLRTRPAADAIKFTLDQRALKEENVARRANGRVHTEPPPPPPSSSSWKGSGERAEAEDGAATDDASSTASTPTVVVTPRTAAAESYAAMACSLDNKDECLACGS
eukprot:ctg_711.g315